MTRKSPGSASRILVVDDEEMNRELMRDLLEAQEYSITECANGVDGLDKARTDLPDLILLDVIMPKMNGLDVCRHLKNDPSTAAIPVLLITSVSDRTSRLKGMEAGANDFISKPVDMEDLLLRVRNALFSKELYDRLQDSNKNLEAMISREKELLEKTLTGSIRVLTDVLGLVNPAAFSRSKTVTQYVRHVVSELGLPDAWRFETAALLSQLGCVTLHPDTMEAIFAGQSVSPEETVRFIRHPATTSQLLAGIPRLEYVATLIGMQAGDALDTTSPKSLTDRNSPEFGALILKACLEFDRHIRAGLPPDAVKLRLQESKPRYPPEITASLAQLPPELFPFEVRNIQADEMLPSMILDEDVRTGNGTLLVPKGTLLTEPVLLRLLSFHIRRSIPKAIRVLVRTQPPE